MKTRNLFALFILIVLLVTACRPETVEEKSVGWLDGSPAGADRGAARTAEGEAGVMLASADHEEVVKEVEASAPMESLGDVPAAESAAREPAAEESVVEVAQQSRLSAGDHQWQTNDLASLN